jgi:hypothetical protein
MQTEAQMANNIGAEVTQMQPLVEIAANDSKLKFSTEDARIRLDFHPKLYMAVNSQAASLRGFLEAEKQYPSSVPCKVLHVNFQFCQNILLEVQILAYIKK